MPITLYLYRFDELGEDAQQKALEDLWNINVDHGWWDRIYEDAATIGLIITEFDLDNSKRIAGELKEYLLDCCKLIRINHGRTTETFATARDYVSKWAVEFSKWKETQEDNPDWGPADWIYEFNYESDHIEEEFKKVLLQDYFSMLNKEYEYLTSPEAVKEAILANEYLFTAAGYKVT